MSMAKPVCYVCASERVSADAASNFEPCGECDRAPLPSAQKTDLSFDVDFAPSIIDVTTVCKEVSARV